MSLSGFKMSEDQDQNPRITMDTTVEYKHTHTHTHNRFTALLESVRDYPGEQVPER